MPHIDLSNPLNRIGSTLDRSSVVVNCDCLEGMKQFEDKWFDLALIDPPYGIGVSNSAEIGYKGFNVFKPKDWDNYKPQEQYFQELFRISKNQIVFGGNYFKLPETRCFIIWDKGEGFYNRSYAECEMAWTSFDANARIFKRDPLAKGDYKNKIHPTQKPVALYSWIYKNYLPEGGKVIDTHLGSGSNRIAADKAGNIDFTGYELDLDYFNAQEKRWKEYKSQLTMKF